MRRFRRLFAVFIVGALFAACATAGGGGGGGGGGTSPSPQPDRLVVRIETGGGLVPFDVLFRNIPEFSLFEDGRAMTQGPQTAIYPGPALPDLVQRRVTSRGFQRILDEARKAGLYGPDRSYLLANVADATTTRFTLIESGRRHTVSVYALDLDPGSSGLGQGDVAARKALRQFRDHMLDLSGWLPNGDVGPEGPYLADRMRVYARSFSGPPEAQDLLKQPSRRWPLATPLATFGSPVPTGAGLRCGVVDGADFDMLYTAAKTATILTPWESKGQNYQLLFRPLLPDEQGC